jgi:hypothetical protein
MSDLVNGGFVVPSSKTELEGQLGLTVHEIAQSLGSRPFEVKAAIEREWDNILDLQAVAITTPNETNGLPFQSYVLSVPAAQFIVARFGNKIGAAYCKYLIQQTRTLEQMERGIENDPMLAIKFGKAVIAAAETRLELVKKQAVIDHAIKSLTTSQVNNGLVTRENNQLKAKVLDLSAQVGNALNYKAVSFVLPQLSASEAAQVGKICVAISSELGIEPKKIPHSKYPKGVNAYHNKVWELYMERYGRPTLKALNP